MYKFLLVLALVSLGCSKEKEGVKKADDLSCKKLCITVYGHCIDSVLVGLLPGIIADAKNNQRDVETEIKLVAKDRLIQADDLVRTCIKQCKGDRAKSVKSHRGYVAASKCYDKYNTVCSNTGYCVGTLLSDQALEDDKRK